MTQRTLGEVDLSEFTPSQAAVMREVILSSSRNPIPLSVMAMRVHQTIRECKGIVEELRTMGQPIGARRGKPHGIYYARTVDELEESARPLVNQAKKMLLGASRLVGKRRLAEWLGQMQIEVSE